MCLCSTVPIKSGRHLQAEWKKRAQIGVAWSFESVGEHLRILLLSPACWPADWLTWQLRAMKASRTCRTLQLPTLIQVWTDLLPGRVQPGQRTRMLLVPFRVISVLFHCNLVPCQYTFWFNINPINLKTRRHLRSANRQLLAVHRYQLNTYGRRAF